MVNELVLQHRHSGGMDPLNRWHAGYTRARFATAGCDEPGRTPFPKGPTFFEGLNFLRGYLFERATLFMRRSRVAGALQAILTLGRQRQYGPAATHPPAATQTLRGA